MSEPKKNGAHRVEPERWSESAGGSTTQIGAPAVENDVSRARSLVARVEPPRARHNARARVFAKIEATRRGGSRAGQTWIWALSGAAAGALAVLIAMRLFAPDAASRVVAPVAVVEQRTAEIVSLEGSVHAGERAQPMAAARVGQRVKSGARVKTNAGSTSVLRVRELGEIELAAETEVALILDEVDRGRGVELALNAGALVAKVERAVAVTAGPWTVRVVGTVFQVVRDGADDIEVAVTKGVVDVDGPNTHVRLHDGERFRSRKLAAAVPSPGVEPSLSPEVEPSPSMKTRVAKTLRAAKTKAQVERRIDAEPRPAEPVRPEVETPSIPEEPDAPSSSARVTAVDPRPLTPEELYARAQNETNPLRAIVLFDAIAATDHPALAEQAAHQAARITMRIGKCTDAVGRFDRILARYPATAYAQEARLNTLECHIRLGELDLAQKDVETFLAKHPTSERLPELRKLRDELQRRKKFPER